MGERKIAAVDLDGVIGEWDTAAMETLKERGDYPLLASPSESWDYIQKNVTKGDWRWLWSHKGGLYTMFSRMKPYPGVVDAMRHLSLLGQVDVVSKRPAGVEELTWWWLTAWEIPFSKLTLVGMGDKKSLYGPWDYAIDDKPENVEDLSGNGKVFLMRRMWNRGFVWPHIVYNLGDFAIAVERERG